MTTRRRTDPSWKLPADLHDEPPSVPASRPAARTPAWVPGRLSGDSDADYTTRYVRAEFRALLDGTLTVSRQTRTDMVGVEQWADPMGGRFG